MKTAYRSCLAVLAALLAFAIPPAARAGVSVGVVPASSSVAPGEEFTLDLAILDAGSPFNGFDAVVEFDPSALTFLPSALLYLKPRAGVPRRSIPVF